MPWPGQCQRKCLRLMVFDDRGQRTRPAVVGADQVEHDTSVMRGAQDGIVGLDHGDARQLVPHSGRVSPHSACPGQRLRERTLEHFQIDRIAPHQLKLETPVDFADIVEAPSHAQILFDRDRQTEPLGDLSGTFAYAATSSGPGLARR